MLYLEECIDALEIELLIFDTWARVEPVSTRTNASAYDIKMDLLKPAQDFAHEKGISIIAVTHTRKAPDPANKYNKIQGSMAAQATCDTMMMLAKDDGDFILSTQGRRTADRDIIFERQTQGTHWDGHWIMG